MFPTDPRVLPMNMTVTYGSFTGEVDAPWISEIAPNLWQGGVLPGLVLPDIFDYHLSLFSEDRYEILHPLRDALAVPMIDAVDEDLGGVPALAAWVNERRAEGPVLVQCQAGLNRSGVVVGAALVAAGDVPNGAAAIDLIRERRSHAALCNPAFAEYLRRR
jgi:protein-tyrosine phosphatase